LESDPVALHYARTLARPGGNITGVFLDLPELSAKQLQLAGEIIFRSTPESVTDPVRMRAPGRAVV